jgi:hypothetical protein
MIAAFREKVWPDVAYRQAAAVHVSPVFVARAAASHRLMESSEHIGKIRLVP